MLSELGPSEADIVAERLGVISRIQDNVGQDPMILAGEAPDVTFQRYYDDTYGDQNPIEIAGEQFTTLVLKAVWNHGVSSLADTLEILAFLPVYTADPSIQADIKQAYADGARRLQDLVDTIKAEYAVQDAVLGHDLEKAAEIAEFAAAIASVGLAAKKLLPLLGKCKDLRSATALRSALRKLASSGDEIAEGTSQITKGRRWRVGDPIDALTADGNVPSWNTARQRYWKNRAATAREGEFNPADLERMRGGGAPIDPATGRPMELEHYIPQRSGGPNRPDNLFEVWDYEHSFFDKHRKGVRDAEGRMWEHSDLDDRP